MHLTLAFLVFASLYSALDRTCGTRDPSPALHASHTRLSLSERTGRIGYLENNVSLDTFVHVVSNGSTPAQGNVPDQQVFDQIDTINKDYAVTGFSFILKAITRTINSEWQNIKEFSPQESAMKSALRQGSYNALNIYLTTLQDDLLGYAYFPTAASDINSLILDGVVVDYRSVPGGSFAPEFGLGRTVTHEAGHWFGLLHTFQGGCKDPGDHVDDTPAEASPAFGCDEGRDTCPAPGLDPIHNFMDYGDDSCMNNFTPGQVIRLKSLFEEYRAHYTGPELPANSGLTASGRSPRHEGDVG